MWVVDRFIKEHNHDLDPPREADKKIPTALIGFRDDTSGGLENLGSVETNDGSHMKRSQESNIGSDWYDVLLEYFQSRQVEDTGFFYAVELDDGRCRSVFWADGRSRFSCSQFGDAIVFDTSYRKSNYLVPFAMFIGVNHHRQPVLLGCALIADECKESFTWVLRTWFRAMSGRHPQSIIADQDKAIRQAIAQVFPGIHHRFSAWQIKAKERENLGRLLSIDSGFKYDYDKCIYQSQTAGEFDAAWNALLNKYRMKGNAWLKEMYEKRESWVPLYLRGTFFAGIPVNGGIKSFFGTLLNAQTPLREFILQYERGLERRREEERQDDFDSSNLQAYLHTKEMIEEQCRRLYTLTVFKVFQKELLDSYGHLGMKISEEGSSVDIWCGSVLCRHILKVFQMVNIRDIPSCYILHRWTKNAKYGFVGDVESDSGGSSQDLKAMMVWGLREEACNYIGAGAASLERIKDLPNEGENAFQTSKYSDKTAAPIMPIRHNKETTSSIRMDESDKK
ncbi:Protein FAR1-related sequence 12 [Vitis vinifera]|uniref:Protein FAR1-RELATED SEQUENCE n=1 Tax=Vitis vinifera TaxID=29760 RepID=A0A438F7H1_VITVI|nr:Protein FAR1-related sequence 12 [Vitis vinifera]